MNRKTNIYIINHGEFGEWLIKSAEMIVGRIENIEPFSLLSGMSIEELSSLVESSILEKEGDNILILTDMFGGTPNNVALYLKQKYECEVISGVNLPMLLELVLTRDNGVNDVQILVDTCIQAGRRSIEHQLVFEIDDDLG